MPLFGAHFSISGGLYKAADTARDLACDTVQLFTKNASQWAAKPLLADEIKAFRDAVANAKLKYPTAHDSYLINLASPQEDLWAKSLNAFTDEVERAEALGLSYLVTHPGTATDDDVNAGLARIVKALKEVRKRCPGYAVKVLLEVTAGQGRTLGHRFEHIGTILQELDKPEWLGVCFDTCHAFAAGYSLWPVKDYEATIQQFDDIIGLDQLKLFHMNDSVKPLGSRVDRHAGLGLGQIPEQFFEHLVNDTRFADLPMILETPKEGDNDESMDPINLSKLRTYWKKKPAGTTKKKPATKTRTPGPS